MITNHEGNDDDNNDEDDDDDYDDDDDDDSNDDDDDYHGHDNDEKTFFPFVRLITYLLLLGISRESMLKTCIVGLDS